MPDADEVAAAIARLREGFAATDVADALSKLKIDGFLEDIHMWSPAFCDGPTKIIGPAHTIAMGLPGTSPQYKGPAHHVDTAPEGSVIVISSPAVKGAVWGGLMATRAKAIGVQGVITDGRCRDLAELRDKQFPVFAGGTSCHGSGGFVVPAAVGDPVSVRGVTIAPGSIIVADLDGVVVIPRDRLADVLAECERAKPIECACMADLEAGQPLAETFAKHRGKK